MTRVLAAAVLAALLATTPASARTIVSLEFDAGSADQARALPLLAEHGMRATFYVNSGFVGKPGRLTFAELRHMQAIGHEVGGQTISHAHLPRLTPAQMRREVCRDRARLLSEGLTADSFAYPFGAYSSLVRNIVIRCGYSSARLASGIAGAGKKCLNCPYAESIPPKNRYATRMPAGVQRTSSLRRLTRSVRDAQRTGGGWVQILMHHVCDHCNRYAITPKTLERLLAWLDRTPGVEVRTVGQLLDLGSPRPRVTRPGTVTRGTRITLGVRGGTARGVQRVRWFVDGRQVGIRNLAPWRLRWFATGLRPGRHTLRALVEDRTGNAGISAQRTFVAR